MNAHLFPTGMDVVKDLKLAPGAGAIAPGKSLDAAFEYSWVGSSGSEERYSAIEE